MSRTSGSHFEEIAAQYLTQQGLQFIERNFHAYRGELDLVMIDPCEKKPLLVFVEVKFRKNAHFGHAAETVTLKKQQSLTHAAQYFLQARQQYRHYPCRFDVVAISGNQLAKQEKIDWIKNAFLIT